MNNDQQQPSLLYGQGQRPVGGPDFTPQPGWSSRFGPFSRFLLILIVIVLIVFGIRRSLNNDDDGQASTSPSPTPFGQSGGITKTIYGEVAQPGQGVTHLARQSLKEYLQANPNITLTPEQKIYVEDYLKDRALENGASTSLDVGDAVDFSGNDIQLAVVAAMGLSAAALAGLTKYANKVQF